MTQPQLSTETIDDLIYSARAGDLAALKEDLGTLSTQHSCSEGSIIASAIDSEPESEGGTGACLLHFPAANGNLGMYSSIYFSWSGDLGGLWTIYVDLWGKGYVTDGDRNFELSSAVSPE